MGAKGVTEVNFGAFPGDTHATVVVTGQTGILTSSRVEAWLEPGVTDDHTSDEHVVESPYLRVIAADIVDGTGFTIHVLYDGGVEALMMPGVSTFRSAATSVYGSNCGVSNGGRVHRTYGKWRVGWVWA